MSAIKDSSETRVVNIADYGAKADGQAVNTRAIQATPRL